MVDMPIVLVGCAGLKGGKDLPAEHREVLAQESSQETADNGRAGAGESVEHNLVPTFPCRFPSEQ